MSKPRNRQVHTTDHRNHRDRPHTPWPKRARPAIREGRGDDSHHERAERGSGGPAVPPHFWRKELHCRVDDILGAVHARKHDVERGIDGKERKTPRSRDDIHEPERSRVGKGEAAKRRREGHDPKPAISFKI